MPAPRTETPKRLNIPDTAAYTGLTVRHIRRLIHERRLPHYLVGSKIILDLEDVDNFMANCRRDVAPPTATTITTVAMLFLSLWTLLFSLLLSVQLPDDVRLLSWAAKRLGIGNSTAYRLAQIGQVPGAFKVGAQWRVSVPKFEREVHGETAEVAK
jgi:excisionase family DNA binding protein